MREEILFEWNPWWKEEFDPEFVDRERYSDVERWMNRKEITAITGVRRSGKTTLMYMAVENLLEEVEPENILFIKCDDERTGENVIEEARDKYKELHDTRGQTYLFLDEIQTVDNWEETLKRIYDLEDLKILISGSRLLRKELSSSLAGRFALLEVYPFSFREYLRAKDVDVEGRRQAVEKSDRVRHHLRNYLEWGGFPEVALEEDSQMRKELLKFYSDTILYRDVVDRKEIQKADVIEKLKSYLLANFANLLNYNRIAGKLGMSPETASHYVKAMEEAYFFFPMKRFAYSTTKQERNPKKVYCVDNGIRNAAGFRFSEDKGRLYENAVFVELKRRGRETYYWKDQKDREVDFLVKEGQDVKEAIQVCYSFEEAEERELRPLESAVKNFDLEKATVITNKTRDTRDIGGVEVEIVPLWEWLLRTS